MTDIKKILLARNELENKISDIQQALKLSEAEMMIAVEMSLGTSRYTAIVRGIYDEVKTTENKGEKE